MTFVVYGIFNRVRGQVYVGSSTQFKVRRDEHVYLLRTKRHHNPHLQRSWSKYGEHAFSIEILESGLSDDGALREAEQRWMERFTALGIQLFNVCRNPTRTTYGTKFGPRPEVVKAKIRASQLGKTRTPETRERLRLLALGTSHHNTPHTEASKQKISQAKRGSVWVTNGVISRMVLPTDLPELLAAGYVRGRALTSQLPNFQTP